MASSENKHERIHKACLDLELALQSFENNLGNSELASSAESRLAEASHPGDGTTPPKPATDKIFALKQKLIEIRRQLDNLSI